VSKLVNSDAFPRPTTQARSHTAPPDVKVVRRRVGGKARAPGPASHGRSSHDMP
jgi:hypothetical protein